ncbi:Holliday junction resolvase RuvX [Gelria sp. Kuro-4]|uniref:Holliday junction resolvase RuvX n=1 Tax=Gelria sp. Kuro-4 TaxID=2796927 RepID=UPI001BEDC6DE|nr:Holliday junction resolvase RuvX [Gelria sp. Kuro-4]BCV25186.1 putative pre-16S rRNA nuclease [Gelria sp. Kuro-4]
MRVMGLDVGTATIGVAVSDELGYTAQGVEVIRRTGLKTDLERLGELARAYQVESVVVGIPRNMNGTYGPAAEEVRRFAQEIKKRLGLPLYEEDERLTTVAAERALLEADLSRRRRRQVVDQVAAVLILQSFLQRRRQKG